MDCNISINNPKCYDSKAGRIDLCITDNVGKVFTEWQNLPPDAILTNDGKSVYNISQGIYNLIIFDDISQQSFKINIDTPPKLNIDFIKVDPPKCIDTLQQLEVGWSGGEAPYKIYIDNIYQENLYEGYFKHFITPNKKYTIQIVDKNNCKVNSDEIYYKIQPIVLNLDIEHPECSGCKAKKIKLNVSGGKPPYKIGWFDKMSPNSPIITNKTEINNKLGGGRYSVSVIDENNCYVTKNFVIESPNPIRVQSKIKADYSHEQYYDPVKVNKIYNLLLLDKSIPTIELGSYINILSSNGEEITVRLVLDTGTTTIGKIEYSYYYIAPGFSNLDTTQKYFVVLEGKQYPLSLNLDNNSKNKLIFGSLILENNFSFAFKQNDIIEINYEQNKILSKINHIYIVKGYYLGDIITTIITFLNQNNSEKILRLLNTPATKDFVVASKTTKKNQHLGNINLVISGGYGKKYQVQCVGNNYDNKFIVNNNYLIIDKLHAGTYKLYITDGTNFAEYHNDVPIENHQAGVNIYISGSVEEERQLLTDIISDKYKIDKALLNNYNNLPERLPTFSHKNEDTKLVINIAPTDAEFHISGLDSNYDFKSVGYQSISKIPPGVYTILVTKKGYKQHLVEFSVIKNNFNMVTVILEKDKIR